MDGKAGVASVISAVVEAMEVLTLMAATGGLATIRELFHTWDPVVHQQAV